MDTAKFRQELEDTVKDAGAVAFGIADLDKLKEKVPGVLDNVPGDFTRAVVIGMRLQDGVVEGIDKQPTVLYFHNYRQLNYQLDKLAWTVADKIQAQGHNSVAIPASQIIKSTPMQGHVSHKLMGWAAGIGFYGRQTLLVHPEYGSRMRYVSILTNMPLPADKPYSGEECGNCRACIAVCPAGAIKDDHKQFDLDACYKKLTEFTRIAYIGQHICGVCVKACTKKNRKSAG